jgi:hypothetical protein
MRRLGIVTSLVALIALGSCTDNARPEASAPPPPPPPAEAASASAKPVDCLAIASISESRVVDDSTIDFYTGPGNTAYRNHLPNSCPQLGFERAFGYSTSLSQLCSVDTIWVVVQGGGVHHGATCGLGPFVPLANPPR